MSLPATMHCRSVMVKATIMSGEKVRTSKILGYRYIPSIAPKLDSLECYIYGVSPDVRFLLFI